MRLFSQPQRRLYIIEQTNVGSPRNDLNCLFIQRIIYKLIESLLDVVMHELLPFCCVVCDVACNMWRRFVVDRSVQFHQFDSAIKV